MFGRRVRALFLALCAVGISGGVALAQEAPRVVESATAEGGWTVSGSITVGDQTWTGEQLAALVRLHQTRPEEIPLDLPPEVRMAIYTLAGEIH